MTPAAGNVEELYLVYHARHRRIDQQPIPNGLESQQRTEQQQGSSRGPGLRTACGRILDWELGVFARIAGKCLREPALEVLGGLQDSKSDTGGFFTIPIAS